MAVALAAAAALLPAAPASAAGLVARSASSGTSASGLRSALTALLPGLSGRYTVVVRELDGARRTVRIRAAAGRYPASTGKLFVATGVYSRIDAHRKYRPSELVQTDAAIVWGPRSRYVLTVRFVRGTGVEVIESLRSRYLVRIRGRVGWAANSGLVLAHPVRLPPGV